MKRYVVGLLFTPDFSEVLLMTKNRPDWQVGRLNGHGGKLEAGEQPIDAMVRECTEETGLSIAASDWHEISIMSGPDWEVTFYGAVWSGDPSEAKTMTDEQVAWYPTNQLPANVIDNLRWIIPLAVNKIQAVDELVFAAVEYRQ